MQRAYELARRHRAHPNPRVGAVVASPDGRVLGEGSHVGPGERHAEVVALDQAGDASGSTVYVSLEPCTHQGLTPPCVERLISERVARVVIGVLDPDERVSGTGVQRLRQAGIEVSVLDDPQARLVDEAYFHHRETGMPLVSLKYAMTLDGSLAAVDGSSHWITSEPAREDAHRLRAEHDAIVVGSGTVAADDPRLDVRVPGYDGRQPTPVIVAGTGELPSAARLWDRHPLVIATHEISTPTGKLLIVDGDGRPDPRAASRALADAGYLSLLVEGGASLAGAWWRSGVVSRGVVYIGGRIGGGTGLSPLGGIFSSIEDVTDVVIVDTRQLGPDLRVEFEIGH